MELPLADEIRTARRLVEASANAEDHLSRVQALIVTIHILETQVQIAPHLELNVPGDDLVDELAEQWPMLEDLIATGPRPPQPVATRMRLRREQMQAALQVLRPVAHETHELGHALQHLQERQRQLMTGPEFAAVREELAAWHAERGRIAAEVGPLAHRQAMVSPAVHLIDTFVTQLRGEEQSVVATHDPQGIAAWRALAVANNTVATLASVLPELRFDLTIPEAPAIPDEPDPDQHDARLATLQKTLDGLNTLQAALQIEADAVSTAIDALMARHAELTRIIQERTG